MSVISIFSGKFCNEKSIIIKLKNELILKVFDDKYILDKASKLLDLEPAKMQKVFESKIPIFNKFTREREKSIAALKLAVANELACPDVIYSGYITHLIPRELSHILRICLIADKKYRINQAKNEGVDEKTIEKIINESDERKAFWTYSVMKESDPWKSELYDIIIPTDKMSMEDIVNLIKDNIDSIVLKPTKTSLRAEKDFLLAAKVEFELSRNGHFVDVIARDGMVTLVINKNVLFLGKLEEELKEIAGKVDGVNSIETRVGKGYYKTDIYHRFDFELPQKVLLVDDEREFVQTLSERLLIRNIGSTIAFDGESAIEILENEEPEVMVLDLKMPGKDGIEVLKHVKATKPNVEVIILTGHGSEADREICMELGAFAYLNKPVNIQLLSDTMKKAYEKIQKNKAIS
ncbi:response regulator [Bacteroidetes/Chlorobi group bacterium ChocPot_Mid]|jgi:CheY-like chemotaxis protein|nr:MAG: response regulator [Bacteroidetes/Chlorobi group bacterium ChocPot_Mid]